MHTVNNSKVDIYVTTTQLKNGTLPETPHVILYNYALILHLE